MFCVYISSKMSKSSTNSLKTRFRLNFHNYYLNYYTNFGNIRFFFLLPDPILKSWYFSEPCPVYMLAGILISDLSRPKIHFDHLLEISMYILACLNSGIVSHNNFHHSVSISPSGYLLERFSAQHRKVLGRWRILLLHFFFPSALHFSQLSIVIL